MSASATHRSRHIDRRFTVPAIRQFRPIRLNALREVGIISLAVFLYFFVRGLMHSKVDLATANAHKLVDFERGIGIFHEPQIQQWVTRHDWLVDAFNSVYIYGHWPVLVGTLVWLLVAHREYFPVFRSALLISGAIGLIVFVTFPMAPPRFIPELGFVDTVTLHTEAYRVLQPPAFTNQYAAMPSLHVGWNLLMGVAIVLLARNRFAKLFGILMPLTMYSATILTANHYIMDGIAGSIVAMTGLAIAWRISRPRTEIQENREAGHAEFTTLQRLPQPHRADAAA